jgi:hypothetical protein
MQQQQQHDHHLDSFFSNIIPLSSLPSVLLPLSTPPPLLYLARAAPHPSGSSAPPPLGSKKQDSQAAPPLKRLRDAMYANNMLYHFITVTLFIMHALCFESRSRPPTKNTNPKPRQTIH